MTDIRKVMACVDLSDYTRMTIEEALMVTKGIPAEIVLLNVINNRDIDAIRTVSPYFPGNFSAETYIERISMERRRQITEIIDQLF